MDGRLFCQPVIFVVAFGHQKSANRTLAALEWVALNISSREKRFVQLLPNATPRTIIKFYSNLSDAS